MASNAVGIGLVGCGVVGGGVVKLLVEQAEMYAARLGRPLALRRVICRREDVGEATAQVPSDCLVHDIDAFFATPDMDIVIELAGGTGFAKAVVEQAIKAGKHVVTANKALLSAHGPELFKLARENGVAIGFEASCGGGIPIITAMQHNLSSNQMTAMYGILNGTCNYILTQMTGQGQAYADALADAQALGYAEADPTLDVTGGDTMHKLVILASMLFGAQVREADVPCRGIDTLDLLDIRYAQQMGYTIKLLATAERSEGGLALSVAPCFVHNDEPLAQVSGSFNAVSLFGDAVGHTMYYGRGAGRMPTASAVVGDVLNIATGAYAALYKNLRMWADQQPAAPLVDPGELSSRYYLRINPLDVPGVVAQFSSVLGDEGISIAAVSQHEQAVGQFVPVVIITHEASFGAVSRAAKRIAELDVIEGSPVVIRIIDMPEG
jgi:homoserine dehydrogenase